jgi:hypothetical protein
MVLESTKDSFFYFVQTLRYKNLHFIHANPITFYKYIIQLNYIIIAKVINVMLVFN